jgi:hypothetical protein
MKIGISINSSYNVDDARDGARWMIEQAKPAINRAARLATDGWPRRTSHRRPPDGVWTPILSPATDINASRASRPSGAGRGHRRKGGVCRLSRVSARGDDCR